MDALLPLSLEAATPWPRALPSFDAVVERHAATLTSFSERDALGVSHWDMGEDARLREDVRFRPTPGGRWILSGHLLANDALFSSFVRELRPELDLETALAELSEMARRRCVFCPADERFVFREGRLRLSAKFLSDRPLIEQDIAVVDQYRTHLPIHSLEAAAASEPAGEWGARAPDHAIETLGWLRVKLPTGRQLNEQMFVAQIAGHSMDDGRSGLVDGGFAVFELWPQGTRQNQRVLVRGAFTDPETGHYAVKKYVGDIRDSEGRHHRITLVSLNPDKERFPDIALDVEDEDHVVVVAKVTHALAPDELARKPKPVRRIGRRNLLDPDAQQARVTRMQDAAGRFFLDVAPTDEGAPDAESRVDWQARLICMDVDSGGLALETRPFTWLPPFARKLSLTSGTSQVVLLGSNLRNRLCRTVVAPSTAPYRWSAGDHDELLGPELAGLEVPGLADNRITLFRVDAAGIGQPMSGRVVSAASTYRLIVPPDLTVPPGLPGEVHVGLAGWRLWELSIPAAPGADLRQGLADLGLALGSASAFVRCVLQVPLAYDLTPRGEAYPVYQPASGPIVAIDGLRCRYLGEVMLLLAGEHGSVCLPLGAGDSWTVVLSDLEAGRYVLEVVHERTRFASVTLPFAISTAADRHVPVHLVATHPAVEVEHGADDHFHMEMDLSDLEEWERLTITAPPLWPFNVWWDDGLRRLLGRVCAEPNGTLDLTPINARLLDTLARCALGTLTLDGAELGLVELRHRQTSSVARLHGRLVALVAERLETAAALDGQFELLLNLWLHPLLTLLGYGHEAPAEGQIEGAPTGTTGLRLVVHHRQAGRIRARTARALVLVSAGCDVNATGPLSARRFADVLCRRWDVDEALVTDGVRWVKHARGVHVRRRVYRIDHAVRATEPFALDEFLGEFAVTAVEG